MYVYDPGNLAPNFTHSPPQAERPDCFYLSSVLHNWHDSVSLQCSCLFSQHLAYSKSRDFRGQEKGWAELPVDAMTTKKALSLQSLGVSVTSAPLQSPGLAGPGRCTPPKIPADSRSQNSEAYCSLAALSEHLHPALWLVRTKGTYFMLRITHLPAALTGQTGWVSKVLTSSSTCRFSQGVLKYRPFGWEWHQAGEDRCVAKRLPGIVFGPNWSVSCQEGHPLAGHYLDFIGRVSGSCEQMLLCSL